MLVLIEMLVTKQMSTSIRKVASNPVSFDYYRVTSQADYYRVTIGPRYSPSFDYYRVTTIWNLLKITTGLLAGAPIVKCKISHLRCRGDVARILIRPFYRVTTDSVVTR